MSGCLPQMLQSIYRREPVFSFIVTIALVNAAIGGLSAHWILMVLGLTTTGVSVGWRWWRQQQPHKPSSESPHRPSLYALPPQTSRPSLPMLTIEKKDPPRS